MNSGSAAFITHLFPLVQLDSSFCGWQWCTPRRGREKKNGYKSLLAMSSTKHSRLLHMQSIVDDDDDGRRSVAHTHTQLTLMRCLYSSRQNANISSIRSFSVDRRRRRENRDSPPHDGRLHFETVYKHTHTAAAAAAYICTKGKIIVSRPFFSFREQKHRLELIRRRLVLLATVYDVNPSTV